jgi:LmbE family N-acetylglucosaminyl deacetylase
VISAGGIGARNARLGGVTRIVYLAPDEHQGMAEVRAAEARAAWQGAGVEADNLRHIRLLPPLRSRDPAMLRDAAKTLRSIIDDFKPTTVVVPMFEGGHVHHDMVAALIGSIVRPDDPFEVFEAPEYGPYLSLFNTPHRLLALCARWLFGLVSYYGPPDGIDNRTILKLRMVPEELACKRRMLSAFVSQNAPSLMATRSHCDRLVRMVPGAGKVAPFNFQASYLRFVLAARRLMWPRLVDQIFPVQLGTIGREPAITDWRHEWDPGIAGEAQGER